MSIGFRREGAKRLVFVTAEDRFSNWLRKLLGDRNRIFERLFLNLYQQDDEYFDKKKLGELSYLTICGNLHKLTSHVV